VHAALSKDPEVRGQADRSKKQQQKWCLGRSVEGNAEPDRPSRQKCQQREDKATDDRGGNAVAGQ